MSSRKVKSSAKMFDSDPSLLKSTVVNTLRKAEAIVGSTLGPSGKLVIIEGNTYGLPNIITKDGVTVLKNLGANNAYEHLILEEIRGVAVRTAAESGDGTSTSLILASSLVSNLFNYCERNRKESPQRSARLISKYLDTKVIPSLRSKAIKINDSNSPLLELVAKTSANGDEEMAKAIIQSFEAVGFGDSSHVTIQEIPGSSGYKVERIEGFPIFSGYEESCGKFGPAFINDQGTQRCVLEKPLFILYNGTINDFVTLHPILEKIGQEYTEKHDDFYKNVVIVAHGFGESVITYLSYNFANHLTINVVPMRAPMDQFSNSQTHFLKDLQAFTGAKLFDMTTPLTNAMPSDFGKGMVQFEMQRFRSTLVGDSDEFNIEIRADELETQLKVSESKAETAYLQERIGKLTKGIAKLKIFGSSSGELREKHDRADDAVCAVRASITHGVLPGGCRSLIDLVMEIVTDPDAPPVVKEVLAQAMLVPFKRLLENAGYNQEEIDDINTKMLTNPGCVYNVETQEFGKAEDMGVFDAEYAVEQALKNSVSISSVMGNLGGIIAFPRDNMLERQEASEDMEFMRNANGAEHINESNERG